MAKTLIAYFSRADENYFGGAMRYVKVGNTEIVCREMAEMLDADSFKIEMAQPYSPVYMTCIDVFGAVRLQRQGDPAPVHQRRQRHGQQRGGHPQVRLRRGGAQGAVRPGQPGGVGR